MSEPIKLADLLAVPLHLGAPTVFTGSHAEWDRSGIKFFVWTQARKFQLQMDAGNGAWRCDVSRFGTIVDVRETINGAMEEARFLSRINDVPDGEGP